MTDGQRTDDDDGRTWTDGQRTDDDDGTDDRTDGRTEDDDDDDDDGTRRDTTGHDGTDGERIFIYKCVLSFNQNIGTKFRMSQ